MIQFMKDELYGREKVVFTQGRVACNGLQYPIYNIAGKIFNVIFLTVIHILDLWANFYFDIRDFMYAGTLPNPGPWQRSCIHIYRVRVDRLMIQF